MSKERPIPFNAPMVLAVVAGTKTQTRRLVTPAPKMVTDKRIEPWTGAPTTLLQLLQASKRSCPYGKPGDRVWVRETFFAYGRWVTRYSEKKRRDEWHFIDMTAECDRAYQYDADSPDLPSAAGRGALPGWYKRPSIFMPRAACRILLEIVSVRVERLQDISDADIVAEGIDMEALAESQDRYDIVCKGSGASERATERTAWRDLWESTGGDWDANPWCWVISFKRVAP
ncbi:hypothetical protein [Janthinobacterium sp. SUN137]|uniref:hypothetical protein n=1 Tax=Janthinobacterium sp. SUN137 TaxID=3014789 RepID=UPI002713A976|nr:hypothetical protein [Janthinobacterium sp. SUN137]MDO8039447.1 hypothetical protein [Janthinobacterium sp. SUN137]